MAWCRAIGCVCIVLVGLSSYHHKHKFSSCILEMVIVAYGFISPEHSGTLVLEIYLFFKVVDHLICSLTRIILHLVISVKGIDPIWNSQ